MGEWEINRNISQTGDCGANNKSRKRLNWKHKAMGAEEPEARPPSPKAPREGWSVVKGTTHRIIVVKSPDKRYFEEAIFVVRDDVLRERGADSAAVLKEARKIAGSYMGRSRKNKEKKQKTSFISKLPAPVIAAAGAAATGVAWLTARLCGL